MNSKIEKIKMDYYSKKLRHKYLWMIYVFIIFLSSCYTPKRLFIQPDKKTEELTLFINPTKKTFGLGIVLFKPLFLNVGIPELITSIKIIDSEENILWRVEAKLPEFGGHGLKYGVLNDKEYNQINPATGDPVKLIEGNDYKIELETVEYSYLKEFKYQHSIVFITEKDIN